MDICIDNESDDDSPDEIQIDDDDDEFDDLILEVPVRKTIKELSKSLFLFTVHHCEHVYTYNNWFVVFKPERLASLFHTTPFSRVDSGSVYTGQDSPGRDNNLRRLPFLPAPTACLQQPSLNLILSYDDNFTC